jgi:hypothetical protein
MHLEPSGIAASIKLAQAHEAKLLAVMAAVGSLGQLAIAAQIGKVDFATHQQNRRQQGQKKLLLGFAKCPILANRACKMVFIATSGVFDSIPAPYKRR